MWLEYVNNFKLPSISILIWHCCTKWDTTQILWSFWNSLSAKFLNDFFLVGSFWKDWGKKTEMAFRPSVRGVKLTAKKILKSGNPRHKEWWIMRRSFLNLGRAVSRLAFSTSIQKINGDAKTEHPPLEQFFLLAFYVHTLVTNSTLWCDRSRHTSSDRATLLRI